MTVSEGLRNTCYVRHRRGICGWLCCEIMRKTFKVLVLIETSEAYGQRLLRGIINYSYLHGPWTFCTEIPLYRRSRTKTKINAADMGCHGVITYIPSAKKIDQDVIAGLPAVVFHGTIKIPSLDSCVSARSDFRETGRMGAEYLLNRGFRHFAYCGFKGMRWANERGKSFAERIAEAGLVTYHYDKLPKQPNKLSKSENSLLADWLKSLPKPIGLMACNDERAKQVVEVCQAEDIYVPDEIAVLGVDDDDLICGLVNPPLSSIALSAGKSGYEAAEILGKLMSGKRIGGYEIVIRPTHVVTRQSTEILAIEDREVAEAIRFIRLNAESLIQVDDVVNKVAISRTSLSERFLRRIGRSIHKEIKRVRIERIVKYLIESDLSILQIARKMGYDDVDHISRYFKKEKEITPQAYRKKYKS